MSSSTSLRASDTLAKVLDFSAQLRQNAAEDYLAYIKVACAARRGVRISVLTMLYILEQMCPAPIEQSLCYSGSVC